MDTVGDGDTNEEDATSERQKQDEAHIPRGNRQTHEGGKRTKQSSRRGQEDTSTESAQSKNYTGRKMAMLPVLETANGRSQSGSVDEKGRNKLGLSCAKLNSS